MSPEFDRDRLVHYFAGECSDEEKAQIEAWFEADPLRRQEAEALRHLWEAAGRPPAQPSNLDAPFEEVAKELERWYDLKVKLADPLAEVDRLNATFEDEPVGVVLDIIAKTLGRRYERDGRVVTFYPAGTDPS